MGACHYRSGSVHTFLIFKSLFILYTKLLKHPNLDCPPPALVEIIWFGLLTESYL